MNEFTMTVKKMAKLTCVLLLVAAAACAHANRIIGGNPVPIEKYPGIVQVEYHSYILWRHLCGANILTSRYLLSAAHCFGGVGVRDRRIRAGAETRGTGGVVIFIKRAVNHPSYDLNGDLDGDISVVELDTPLVFSDKIQPRPIPPQGFQLPAGLPVWFAGWGYTSNGILPSPSAELRDVQIFTVDHEYCSSLYNSLFVPQNITENMICSGNLGVGGMGSCSGDSGGPMYYDNIIFGLVSWSIGCADDVYPEVSVAVSSYTDWIVATAV